MDLRDSAEYRLLQVFLSKESGYVFEVLWCITDDTHFCTCPGFARRRDCVHVRYIEDHSHPEAGYAMQVSHPENVDLNTVAHHMMSPSEFRMWVLEQCEVVVL